jgi:hypothetical protein
VDVVGSRARHFVVFIGTLLSFAEAGPLSAGLISVSPIYDYTPANSLFGDAPFLLEEYSNPETNVASAEWLPRVTCQDAVLPSRSPSLMAGALQDISPPDSPFPDAEPGGLPGKDEVPSPVPQPSAPSGGGATGGIGFVPGGSKDQQEGLPSWSNPPIAERDENATSYFIQFVSDAPAFGVFRPPRAIPQVFNQSSFQIQHYQHCVFLNS